MQRRVAHLHLRTFGRLALLDESGNEEPSLATRPRKLALLAWLALRPGRRATRDRMIGVFWGDRDEERARNSLSDALSHLRRVLGRDAIRTQADDVFIADDAPLTVDALELGSVAAARDHTRVVSLYGGPFLDGFYVNDAPEFDDWRDRERERFAGLFGKGAAVRCRELTAAGSWDECRDLADRWLDAEPASAEAALSLLRAIKAPETHAAYAAVVAAFEGLVQRLDHRVGIAPDAAVTAFAQEVSALLAATPAPLVLEVARPTVVEATASRPPAPIRSRSLMPVLAVAGLVLVAAGAVAMRRSLAPLDHRRVVVAAFQNRTGDTTLSQLGAIAADWISRGLIETRAVEVVDPVVTAARKDVAMDPRTIGREVAAGIVVMGSFVSQGDSIAMDARLVDAETGRVLRAIQPAIAAVTEPLVAVNVVRQRVAGALAAEVDPVIAALARESSQPPTYDAYLAWVEGLDLYSHKDFRGSIAPLLRAAALDSSFVSPRLWAAAAFGNSGNYPRCDSILRTVLPMRDRLAPLDRGLLDIWIAVIQGDRTAAYVAAHQMLAAAPASELALFLTGIQAIEVNRPDEAVRLLRRIPVERSGAEWDAYGTRLSTALHFTGRHHEELAETSRRRARQPTSLRAMEEHAWALVALGRVAEVDPLVSDMLTAGRDPSRSAGTGVMLIAEELIAHGYPREAAATYRRLEQWVRSRPTAEAQSTLSRFLLARSLFRTGDVIAADSLARELLANQPQSPAYLTFFGVVAIARGDTLEANRVANVLASLETPYMRGQNTLGRARLAARLGRKDEAVRLLRQAKSEGVSSLDLHPQADLQSLKGYPAFEALIKPIG